MPCQPQIISSSWSNNLIDNQINLMAAKEPQLDLNCQTAANSFWTTVVVCNTEEDRGEGGVSEGHQRHVCSSHYRWDHSSERSYRLDSQTYFTPPNTRSSWMWTEEWGQSKQHTKNQLTEQHQWSDVIFICSLLLNLYIIFILLRIYLWFMIHCGSA